MSILKLYLIFSALCTVTVLFKPGWGLWLMLVVGLLADPVRKMVPGNPVYIQVVFVGILALLLLTVRRIRSRGQSITALFPNVRLAMLFFIPWFVVSAFRPLLIDTAYLPLVVYGSGQYLGLFVATRLGYDLLKNERMLVTYADIFVATLIPFFISVLLHFRGLEQSYPVLGVMGMKDGQWLRYYLGEEPLRMLCGLFRNPEGMGWFAMTASITACYLMTRKMRSPLHLIYYGGVFLLSLSCALLSGRRKFFLGVFFYLAVFVLLSLRKHTKRAFLYLALFLIAGGIFFYYSQRQEGARLYIQGGSSGVVDAKERMGAGLIGSVRWAIARDGFFGRGIGTTSQGGEHLGLSLVQGSGIESGPGKIVSELGVPGAAAFVMIVLSYGAGVYQKLLRGGTEEADAATGYFLMALMGTHLTEFLVSHQIYADPLVATLTGLTAGFLLAIVRIRRFDGDRPRPFKARANVS